MSSFAQEDTRSVTGSPDLEVPDQSLHLNGRRKQMFPKRNHHVCVAEDDGSFDASSATVSDVTTDLPPDSSHSNATKPSPGMILNRPDNSTAKATERPSVKTTSPRSGVPHTICIPIHLLKQGSSLGIPMSCHPPSVPAQRARMISSLLKSPAATETDSKVSSIVSTIVSKTKSTTKPNPPAQQYVVMPVIKTKGTVVQYVLVNSETASRIAAQKASPSDTVKASITLIAAPSTSKPKCGTEPNVDVKLPESATRPPTCMAIISANLNTVSKWLNCNRDMLHKSLLSVSEKLRLGCIVSILLLGYNEQSTERVAIKWIGIALLLIVQHLIRLATSATGAPIPNRLWAMWTELREFFAVYEGCCVIAKNQQVKKTTAPERLHSEDDLFEAVVTNIFKVYNDKTNSALPLPQDLSQLSDFISSLVPRHGTTGPVDSRHNGNESGITTVVNDPPRVSTRARIIYTPPTCCKRKSKEVESLHKKTCVLTKKSNPAQRSVKKTTSTKVNRKSLRDSAGTKVAYEGPSHDNLCPTVSPVPSITALEPTVDSIAQASDSITPIMPNGTTATKRLRRAKQIFTL